MRSLSLREFAVPIIKAIDGFNYLLKSHHRRVAIISYYLGKELGLSDRALFELVVAASLHDIGALSAQEKSMLLEEDVKNPLPHCIMGYKMLLPFTPFEKISRIIRYHHIHYQEASVDTDVPFESYIIHLADRVDILTSLDKDILGQRDRIMRRIKEKNTTIFHPQVIESFERIASNDAFWFDVRDASMSTLFNKLNVELDLDASIENLIGFAAVLSRITDYRSHFTSSHSYTVAHLATLFGAYVGFSETKRQKLMIAGYLYDIGKIALSSEQIEEEGALKDTEFNITKAHDYYTESILSELSVHAWFTEIVMWTEKGYTKPGVYPDSVDRQDIEKGTLILAFADMISLLMEPRSYRDAFSIGEVLNIIQAQLTDPLSMDVFNSIREHTDEIDILVLECQQQAFEEYNSALELVMNSRY